MRKIRSALLCMLAALLLAGNAFADQAIAPTVEEAASIEPRAEFYLEEEGKDFAVGYQDPTLEIHITEGRWEETNWMAARIKVAYPTQLRTYMAGGRYGKVPHSRRKDPSDHEQLVDVEP